MESSGVSVEKEALVTKELVLDLARATGEGIKKLDNQYGIEVTSAIYYFEIIPGQESEGIESMYAKNLTLDFEFDNERNATNSLAGMSREGVDLKIVSDGLKRFKEIVDSPTPEDLRDRFDAQIAIVEARINDRLARRDPLDLDKLVDRKMRFYRAKEKIKY